MTEQPPPQEQTYPGSTGAMDPEPNDEMRGYVGRDLLAGRRALITGGDSGIGRAVAVAFAEEGADVAISYLSEGDDAAHTQGLVEAKGRRCVRLPGDIVFIAGGAIPTLYIAYLGIRHTVKNVTLEEPDDILFTEIHEPAGVPKIGGDEATAARTTP